MSDGTMQALLAELVHLRRRVERLETIENLNMAQVAAEYVPTLADQAQATVLGRASGAGTGAPSALTAAQLVAVVATADGTGSGLDADTVDGSHASAFAATSHTHGTSGIDDAAVTLAKLANQAQATVIGRAAAAGTGVPVALTAAQLITILTGADGSGTGLDADLLDGLHATEVAASLFGAVTSAGVANWNDITNTRPGASNQLLRGNDTNGPGGTDYYHALNFEYLTKDGSGQLTQIAIPYAGAVTMFMRGRYLGTWGSWIKIWTEGNDGTGSGLDADTVDGSHASAFAVLASANTFASNQRVPRLEIDSASNYIDIDSAGALQLTSALITIANDGVVVLRNSVGMLIVSDNSGATVGIFTLRGGTGNAFEVFDGSGVYTTTKDNAGTFNVYWDATDSRHELQNKRGLSRSVSLTWLGG